MRLDGRWFVATLALAAAPLAAQNLLANPDFDTDVTGWALGQGASLGWIVDDEVGCPLSGSLAIVSSGTVVTFAAANACANLPPGTTTVAESFRYRGGGLGMTASVGFYDGPGCTGGYLGAVGGATAPPSPGIWSFAEATGLAVPAGAASALLIGSSSGMSIFELDLDRAYLGVRPRIFADGFDAEPPGPLHGCRWSSAAP